MQHGGIGKIPTFKVILLGSSSVGKSSLLRRFVDNQFISEAEATISKNEMSKVIQVFPDEALPFEDVKLMIWDTAGQECFKAINSGYYRDADAAIIVHDLGNESSINEGANYWLEELSKARGSKDINNNYCIALCGNKSDLPLPHAVKQQELDDLVEDFKIDHVAQVSAQEGTGINDMFAEIGKLLL